MIELDLLYDTLHSCLEYTNVLPSLLVTCGRHGKIIESKYYSMFTAPYKKRD